MNKLILTSLAAVLGLASVASADRGDRYSAQRREASIRYERGSRTYDQTYGRYGQASYHGRSDYDRGRSYRHYDSGRRSRSSFGFSFGYSNYGGYAGDSVSLGFGYSSGRSYYRRAPVYIAPPPVIYREYCPPPAYYYAPAPVYYYESRSYYSR